MRLTGSRKITSRLNFGLVLVLAASFAPLPAAAALAPGAYQVMLDLDGAPVLLRGFSGGGSTVLTGGDGMQTAAPTYDEIELQAVLSGGSTLITWFGDFLAGKAGLKSGAVVVCDTYMRMLERLSFTNASLRGLSVADLGATETGQVIGTFTLAPAATAVEIPRNELCKRPTSLPIPATAQNYRLSSQGLPGAAVQGITGLSIVRDGGAMEIGDIELLIAPAMAADFIAWHRTSLTGKPTAKQLMIELMNPARTAAVATFTLTGVRSQQLVFDPATSESIGAPLVRMTVKATGMGYTVPK